MRRDITTLVFVALIIAMLAAAGVNAQSEIEWHDEEGMHIAMSQNKPTMILFSSARCPACAMLADELVDTRVINMSKNFVPVIGSRELDSRYGIRYVPTLVFTDSQGMEVHRIVGYRDADTLMQEMQKVLESSDSLQTAQKQTPGFGVVTALVSLFICGLWARRRHVK
ncbi:MAG: thioredoxin fold domain-containing protein [Euryarchaeota archaeon]|nr:thioredoxin fold domain-containing protein [Euryarchaeota archaeon]